MGYWCLDTSQPGCPEVWEEEADEAISCENEHQEHGVSAIAQEILQGGDAVVDGLGGITPNGIDWKKKINDRARLLRNEDKLPRIREGGNRTPWTLAQAVFLCAMCFFRGKNGAVPYPAEHKKQIAWWKEQERKKIRNSYRKILMDTTGCPPGTKEFSKTIKDMQHYGKTEEKAKKRKREGDEAVRTANMGNDQKHSVEGVAIHLLLVFFRSVIPGFDLVWEVMPVFDGLEADFMMRRKDWDSEDGWVPMQMKSASECVQGRPVSYNLARGDYPHVFCVCVGMLGFVHRTDDVTGPNDIANAPGCSTAEIWNVGSCSDIEKSLGPTFGVPYSKFAAGRRLHFPGATDEEKRVFAEALLRDIENWPRLARNRIFYEISSTINSNIKENNKIEKNGFEVVDAALRTCGMRVDPVWRQNECVDYVVVSVESGEALLFVSGKTGTAKHKHNKTKQRHFPLGGAPNKGFCNVVVACYSGAYHRVAVMSRDTVYGNGKKSFYWNEDQLDPKVRIFDDIRNERVGKEFAHYILSFRRL